MPCRVTILCHVESLYYASILSHVRILSLYSILSGFLLGGDMDCILNSILSHVELVN